MNHDWADSDLVLVDPRYVAQEAKAREANQDDSDSDSGSGGQDREQISKDQRFAKLMTVLNKSQIYSKVLLSTLQTEDCEAKNLKKKKMAARQQIRSANRSQGAAEEMPDEQPLMLTGGIMRGYQVNGFLWLVSLFENGINGILGDEMGLGKTIQVIALICHLVEMEVPGPFLIVAPLSTVPNWVSEFKRFAPLMPVVLYHGSREERAALRHQHFDSSTLISCFSKPQKVRNVIVTSYEIAIRDKKHLGSFKWRYIVVDEGHRLKNNGCCLFKVLSKFECFNKCLLTGTPLQNNLDELWSLLNFVMGQIFDDLSHFRALLDPNSMINRNDNNQAVVHEKESQIVSIMHQILTPFLLRRIKADVYVEIPPKKEIIVYCPMSKKQRDMYEAILNRSIQALLDRQASSMSPKKRAIQCAAEGSNADVKPAKRQRLSKYSSTDLNTPFKGTLNQFLSSACRVTMDKNQSLAGYSAGPKRQTSSDISVSPCNSLMDLRKCTNHPYLIEYPLTQSMDYHISDDLVEVCGKTKILDQLLGALLAAGHKILIFSQMCKMLDILGHFLEWRGLAFTRLDGSMDFASRQKSISAFNTDDTIRIFLLSTRAGGLGINLTSADTCIIYDSDWNPQQDLQAQDRCHRIGQSKPVVVYRLVTANTIDEKIVERAAVKRKLEKIVIHSKKFKSQDSEGVKATLQALSPTELLELLQSKDHSGVVDRADGPLLSRDELLQLLDRSDLINHHLTATKRGKKVLTKPRSDENRKVFKVIRQSMSSTF